MADGDSAGVADAHARTDPSDMVFCERDDVLDPRTERRDVEVEDIQPVEEILSEAILEHCGL